jgi:5-aminolevulinate synthase
VTVWCSNDYLGMGQHPKVRERMTTRRQLRHRRRRHAQHLGHQPPPCGAGEELADLHGKEAALLFTSGLCVELGRAVTLGSRLPDCGDPVGRAEPRLDDRGHPPFARRKVIWKHNDPEDLDRKLAALPANAPKIVAFESVYSMDGDIARWKRSSRWPRSMAR